MIGGVVLFAAAAEEVVLHPGEPLGGFTRLLVAMAIGLAFLAQATIVKRVGGPVLVERIAAAVIVALIMVPSLEVRANIMLLAVLAVLVTALVVEQRRARLPAFEH